MLMFIPLVWGGIHKYVVVVVVVVVGFIDSDIMYTEINCDNTTMYTQKFTADQKYVVQLLIH
jgi:hypothetical protein